MLAALQQIVEEMYLAVRNERASIKANYLTPEVVEGWADALSHVAVTEPPAVTEPRRSPASAESR